MFRNCLISPASYCGAAIRKAISTRFSAAICCESWKRSRNISTEGGKAAESESLASGSLNMEATSKKRRPRIGFHAPIKGGLHNALLVARDTGCDTLQMFSRNPRGWAAKPLTATDIALFRKVRRETKIA